MPEHVIMSEIEIITDGGRRRRWSAAEKLRMRYKTYNDELELAKHYEAEGKVLILAPEDLYGLNTLKKNFEGLEMMYRKGYAAAEAIPAFLQA